MPTATASVLQKESDGLYYTGNSLNYRITGLTSYNLERLRVTLKCFKSKTPAQFQIDTLDLYYARARENFIEACTQSLKVQPLDIHTDLNALITALEDHRVQMKENNGTASPLKEMTEADKKEALSALKHKDLLKNIVSDFDALGFIGEKVNKVLAYLATISRLLTEPLAVLILSRSGAGKTSLQEAVCKFVPPESVIQYTRLTGQALFYRQNLKHKVMAIEEDEGMQPAMYSVKTLISSQKLSVSATRTDTKTGKFSVDEYTVTGPVVVFVSTTNPNGLDDETKQRFLVLTIDETPEQTKNIILAQRTKCSPRWYTLSSDDDSVTKLHHNMQRMLKPLTVTFPETLTITWPYGRLQMRREHRKFFSLIKSITLLHQYQRKRETIRRADGTIVDSVQATQQDVDLALDLGSAVFKRNVDDVSPTGRVLLEEIKKYVEKKYEHMKALGNNEKLNLDEVPFTRKELRESTGWSETQIRQNIEPLVELGYLGRLTGRQGSTFRYVLLDDGLDDPEITFYEKSTS